MITHTINKYPEVAHTTVTSSYVSNLVPMTETNLKEMIADYMKKGYEIGKKYKFKWGGECELIKFREIDKHPTHNIMLNKDKPDIMVVRRLTDNVTVSAFYNLTEIEFLPQ